MVGVDLSTDQPLTEVIEEISKIIDDIIANLTKASVA